MVTFPQFKHINFSQRLQKAIVMQSSQCIVLHKPQRSTILQLAQKARSHVAQRIFGLQSIQVVDLQAMQHHTSLQLVQKLVLHCWAEMGKIRDEIESAKTIRLSRDREGYIRQTVEHTLSQVDNLFGCCSWAWATTMPKPSSKNKSSPSRSLQ